MSFCHSRWCPVTFLMVMLPCAFNLLLLMLQFSVVILARAYMLLVFWRWGGGGAGGCVPIVGFLVDANAVGLGGCWGGVGGGENGLWSFWLAPPRLWGAVCSTEVWYGCCHLLVVMSSLHALSPAPLWGGACGRFVWPRPACVGQCVLQRYGMVAAACQQ